MLAAFAERNARLEALEARGEQPDREQALVIDGPALLVALQEPVVAQLLAFTQRCKAVIGCRVSPRQKAEMVELVRNSEGQAVKTLAIGDGANDVGMIQAAHIGIGISGQEGMQAVNNSDFAIGQFRFLERLLLVHGRWNLKRMSCLVLYMFYKVNLFGLSQLFFSSFVAGWSGQKVFNEICVQAYNIAYTCLPIVLLGVYDQDVPAVYALKVPQLYWRGREGHMFNRRVRNLPPHLLSVPLPLLLRSLTNVRMYECDLLP